MDKHFEKLVNLSFIQGRIKSDLGKFKLCTGSEWSPWLSGIAGSWASVLRVIFTIFFEFGDSWE
jgi:hypothetical protein